MQNQPLEKLCKKPVLKTFVIFTRKGDWKLFLIQNIAKFFRALILKNILRTATSENVYETEKS